MMTPHFDHERAAMALGYVKVAGIDEVGRGPLAGPVTAAAVVLPAGAIPDGLRDSKQLTPARRAVLAAQILAVAEVSIGHATVAEIDRLNILQAALLAMERAATGLVGVDYHLIDGNNIPQGLRGRAQSLVKGDSLSLSIAAASIVAKVTRDQIMVDLAQQHPGYGWDRNAGYPTAEHLVALKNLGVTPWHRCSFAPVHNILWQDKSISP
jgi:ribonuclease HII